MARIVSTLVTLSTAAEIAAFLSAPVDAHSWYPKECCHNQDCAPVETVVRYVPTGGRVGQLMVTSKLGKTLIPRDFPFAESKDGRMHVCMRYDAFGNLEVICAFVPPGM